MKKIAVIGGGVFGATAAIHLARVGHDVHLYEKRAELLGAASGINQYRLHRGYHYPRSPDTALSSLHAEASFRAEYGGAIIGGGRQLYAIAKKGSAVSKEQFLAFCDAHKLPYSIVEPLMVNPIEVDVVIEGKEARFDPSRLRDLATEKLEESGVRIHLSTPADASMKQAYEVIVVAAYADSNSVISLFADAPQEYQFEVCGKPVVRLPVSFGLTDLVVMDGPFMCVDPLGTSGLYVLGNVTHASHATNIGFEPALPAYLKDVLNAGIIAKPPATRFPSFIEHGSQYIPALKDAEHIGSMFTIRTVLPHVEATDTRPTFVTSLNEQCIMILSGKIGTCVEAAQRAVALV